jgi:hypothetical protein
LVDICLQAESKGLKVQGSTFMVKDKEAIKDLSHDKSELNIDDL